MNAIVLLTIIFSTCADFLVRDVGALPTAAKLLPEAMTLLVMIYVLFAGINQKFRNVRATYWLLFALIAIVMICGALTSAVQPGPLVNGIRYYLRPMPFFLLPAVIAFTDTQLRQQLSLLAAICLLQLPLAAWQRLSLLAEHRTTGDPVYGTLMISSVMSMFLIGATCITLGLFLRNKISSRLFVLLFFLMLIPTTINETKGTLVLLPIALFVSLMLGSPPERRLKMLAAATGLLVCFVSIYVPAYDYFNTKGADKHRLASLQDYFTDQEVLSDYLTKDAGVGTRKPAGRIDSVSVPVQELSKDPVRLIFGLGIGNASHSNLGNQFTGRYFGLYGRYTETTTAGALILETGVLGLVIVFMLYWLIFQDARVVAKFDNGYHGGIAIGMLGITVLAALAMIYKPTYFFESLSYMYWYFAGTVAAQRMRLTSNWSARAG
jgi:hypothetical protein